MLQNKVAYETYVTNVVLCEFPC